MEFCEWMANAGKTVIVAALDGTFQRKVSCLIQAWQWVLEGGGDLEHGTIHKMSPEVGMFRIEAVAWWVL